MSASQGEVNGQDSLANGVPMGEGETEGTKNYPTGNDKVFPILHSILVVNSSDFTNFSSPHLFKDHNIQIL